MVYRGKPSAGCETCRKAKKRCGLEQPACQRCVKLKMTCSGYRDTTSLQIQDESETVKLRAERQRTKPQWKRPAHIEAPAGIPTPGSTNSDSSSSSDSSVDLQMPDVELSSFDSSEPSDRIMDIAITSPTILLKPKPDDIATTYFYNQFTSSSHWAFMRSFAQQRKLDPCLELAIKACGMAALDNVQDIVIGKDYARSMYVEALSLLNEALRDPKRRKTDESLIAVAMLGYYENLVCDSRDSIESWKAHVSGATQLLKLRGKAQFKTKIGRILFRETRVQILVHCIWDDLKPPDFLWDLQPELEAQSEDAWYVKPQDDLTLVCINFAVLRSKIRSYEIDDATAAHQASELERDFIQWEMDTLASSELWRYHEIEVPDSEHVWDGRVHSFTGHPGPTPWNTYRAMRIMLSRTQEMLCRRFQFSEAEREEQMQYFRKARRQLTDDICASVPVALGHASPAYSSPCVLITAYGSIWPLFFACTCALERVGPGAWSILNNGSNQPGRSTSAVAAQAKWIIGRLEYISKNVGLKWADGVVATLRGDFKILKNIDNSSVSFL